MLRLVILASLCVPSIAHKWCSKDTSGSCKIFGCKAARGPTECVEGQCVCEKGFCSTVDKETCIDKRGLCDIMTDGSCKLMGCSSTRGPTDCVQHQCRCKKGYCTRDGGKTCVSHWSESELAVEAKPIETKLAVEGKPIDARQCRMETTGTCKLGDCSYTRGPTQCVEGKCLCQIGYCAGVDQKECKDMWGKCDIMTDGGCRVFACSSSRGPTDCLEHKCQCKPGYCTRDGGKTCVSHWSESGSFVESTSANSMLIPAMIIGVVAGLVSTVTVLFAWSRYSRRTDEEDHYLQIE